MKYPCRCNKRSCQARVTRNKHPDDYTTRKWAECPQEGCGGKLYVDKYRLNKGVKDRAKPCREDCLPFPHRVDNKQCKHNTDYIIERSLQPVSKHNPFQNTEVDEF